MLFSRSKTIVAIDDRKVRAVKVSIKSGKAVIEAEIKKEGVLAEIFAQVKKEFKTDSVRLLLPENKTYLKLIEFPLGTGVTRGMVLEKAQEIIPEKLEEGFFDWKQVGADPPNRRTDKKNLKIQILAVSKDYLTPIQESAQKAKLNLEAFEPPSFALARLTAAEKEPHLIICSSANIQTITQPSLTILTASHQGGVFEAITLDDRSQINKKSKELIELVEEKWRVKINKTIDKSLDPILGLALKEDLKGKDEKILNLTPPKIISRVNVMEEEKKEEKKGKIKSVPEKLTDAEEVVKIIPAVETATNNETIESLETKLEEVEELTDEAPPNFTSLDDIQAQPEQKNNKKIVFIVLAVVIVLGAAGGGFYFYNKKKSAPEIQSETETEQIVVSPASEPVEPSPATTPLERKDLAIQVLNGSGIAGKAGKMKDFLEEAGYEEIDTGNAETYDYEEAEIAVKENAKDYLEMLTDDLSEKYSLAEETRTLDEDSEFDVIITVGKK